MKKKWLLSLFALFPIGCTGIPSGITPVKEFDINKYLGTWHEIARLDHRFERGLSEVSATYALRPKGGVTVLNKGFKKSTGQWKSIEGKAKISGDPTEGRLSVSFFGPFYASYNIIYLDSDYQHAIVCGPNKKYLWILARQKEVGDALRESLVNRAKDLGFETDSLITVEQGIEKSVGG
jgi:apolipoprotein D and lipocalin family protein